MSKGNIIEARLIGAWRARRQCDWGSDGAKILDKKIKGYFHAVCFLYPAADRIIKKRKEKQGI